MYSARLTDADSLKPKIKAGIASLMALLNDLASNVVRHQWVGFPLAIPATRPSASIRSSR
jgi:hypothetical protein